VPPDTWVKPYELGDEQLPGVVGPKVEGGVPDGEGFEDAPPGPRHVYEKLKPVFVLPPVYPPRCLRLGIEGRVQVRVLVGENGRVQEATLDRSSGDASLDEAALDAVAKWRFEAARRDGVPVRAWVRVPIEFKLID
jgi:protein TonB